MTNPPMLEDISRMLLALAAPAALLCLVLAGIALRREGGTNLSLGGGSVTLLGVDDLGDVDFATPIDLIAGLFSSPSELASPMMF